MNFFLAIAFSHDQTQVAIGGNDNQVTVWDVGENWENSTLIHRLPHKAAVKALGFCPWAPYLLATGAGSQDRTIRFWHTKTGTFLKKIDVKGQVTSLIWSRHKRQLVATFGFHDAGNPIFLAVFPFPLSSSNSTSLFSNHGSASNNAKQQRRALNALDVRALSFIPGNGIPGGYGTRHENQTREKNDNHKKMKDQRFRENDEYLLSSIPKLGKVASKREGAGGLGYVPSRTAGSRGAGASLNCPMFANRYTNQGRIRSSLATNVVSRLNNKTGTGAHHGSSSAANSKSKNSSINRPVLQVTAPSGLRALSATPSPDGSCICVATNDETVRFFKLWSADDAKVPMQSISSAYYEPHNGVWESKLIELQEDIESIDEIIR